MELPRRKVSRLAAGAALMPLGARVASSQSYPARPVRLIVPYAPGGPTDVFARLVAQKLSDRLGRQFLVDNIPGAGGNIGTGRAAKAPADGYTVLVAVNSFVINPSLYDAVPYGPRTDFDPVTLAVAFATGLSVNPSVPANTVGELVALIAANPGKYAYTSGGVGTPSHLLGELFRMSLSLDLPHISYNGSGPAIAAVVAGHVPIAFTAVTAAVPHINTHALRGLAVLSERRSPSLPGTPTAIEAGYPELVGDGWIGILVPTGSPREVVDLLNREIVGVLGEPDMKERMVPLGFDTVGASPEAFATQLSREMEKWGKVIKAANIKAT